jgi:hypothetical protein
MTLGAAMSGRSHSLESLAKSLQVSHLKGSAEHGKTLTTEYLEYLLRDVQATQDCYDALSTRYASFGLTTPLNAIYSEASLGKAYLRSFGVHPTERLPDDITGKIMSTYYGGRAEVHIRKEIIPVIYTDFLSMYPTVCTKMGIWKYAIAKEIRCYDATERVRKLLAKASHKGPGILRDNGLWGVFPTIVSVVPDNDVLPVRKTYRKGGYNIGVNEVSSSELGQAIWYTLPDCIASCFITGKVPQVIEAIGFEPGETQDNLNTLALMGNEDLQINPYTDDYYKRLIELRKSDTTNADEKQALKILANSTCYGIFVELTRDTVTEPKEHIYYSHDGELHRTRTRYVETPGAYFNPLLATSITGAARMLLAAAERLARDRGVNWALCDTDSMAFCSEETLPGLRTKPVVATASLNVLVDEIVDFFGDLNPYDFGGSILKKEDVNEGGILYAYCVSAKRYALFNDDLQARNMVHDKVCSGIKVRKASAHGLGYLKRPYGKAMTETGAPEWVNDLWVCCIECAGEYEDFCLDSMPMLLAPAQSQVTLNTASLFRQLAGYNAKVSIDERIRPFGFIASYQCNDAKVSALSPMFVSMDDCANTIFDKNTLKEVYREQCKTYRDVLAFFASHPESKFKTDGNGRGILQRRHIEIQDFEVIGKESNRIDPERTQDFAFTVQPMIERKGRIRVRKVED